MDSFTYEDIYELLRTEKYTTDLQPLKKEDMAKIKEYFATKQALLDKQVEGSAFYAPEKRDKLRTELENAKRAVRDLYEKREQKVINRALFSSRTDFRLKDSTNMLSCEAEQYDQLIELLKLGNRKFFEDVEPSMIPSTKDLNAEQSVAQPQSGYAEQKKKLVKFKETIPEIIDAELKKYGPFEPEAIAELPLDIADLLIRRNKAVEHNGQDRADGHVV